MMPRILLFITLISFSNTTHAGWPSKIIDHVKSYKYELKDKFAATMLGACLAPDINYSSMEHVEIKDFEAKNENFEEGHINIKIGFLNNKKAPLMFVIPGAFNNLKDKQPRRLMNTFTKLGYHTVVFPNPWGRQFIKQKFHKPMGSIQAEGQAIYTAMRQAYHYLKRKNLLNGKVHSFGISYGAFLTAMTKAFDAEHAEPIINGHSTVISAPENLGLTLRQLDKLVEQTKHYSVMGLFKVFSIFKKLCAKKTQDDYDLTDLENAKGLATSQGFHLELAKSARTYDRINDINKVPYNWFGLSKSYLKWKKEFTFRQYFDDYNPEGLGEVQSHFGRLDYWVERIKDAGGNGPRFLTASDDFLNDDPDIFLYDPTNSIILPTGGHYGFRHLKWFKEFLTKAFKLTK